MLGWLKLVVKWTKGKFTKQYRYIKAYEETWQEEDCTMCSEWKQNQGCISCLHEMMDKKCSLPLTTFYLNYTMLFLLLECNKKQTVSVGLAGFYTAYELMYWSWRSICSNALSPTGLGFSCLNSATKIEKFDSFPFLGKKWLLCIRLRFA